jgi:hypothetical protein
MWTYETSRSGGVAFPGYAARKNADATHDWELYYNISAGEIWLTLGENLAHTIFSGKGVSPSLNAWHNLVLIKSGTLYSLYLDGILKATDTSSQTWTSSEDLFIGSLGPGGDAITGYLDEFRMFGFAMSQDQIKTLYNQGSMAVMGSTSTDSSGNASFSANEEYCPPGQGSTCTPPVGHWKMDENTGTNSYDISGNNLTGSLANGPVWKTGKFGSGVVFDGDDDEITLPDSALYGFDSADPSFTISGWFQTFTTGTRQGLFGLSSASTQAISVFVHTDNYLYFETFDSNNAYIGPTSTSTLADGTWHHFEAVRDGSNNNLYLYIDGVPVTPETDTRTGHFNGSTYRIGEDDSNFNINGSMDDVRIYNYARSAAQVAWDYNRGKPQGFWKLDEASWNGSAGEVKDSSGNGSNGVRAGNANTTTGKFNNGGTFDGTDDNVRIAESVKIDYGTLTDSYSVSAWFKSSMNVSTAATIMAKGTGTTSPFSLYLNSSENVCFAIGDGTNTPSACSSSVLNDGGWHYVSGIRNVSSDTLSLYIDGKFITSGTDTTTATTANNDDVSIGNSGTSYTQYDFSGEIDDVRIYNYPLTNEQVKLIMNENAATRFAP